MSSWFRTAQICDHVFARIKTSRAVGDGASARSGFGGRQHSLGPQLIYNVRYVLFLVEYSQLSCVLSRTCSVVLRSSQSFFSCFVQIVFVRLSLPLCGFFKLNC